jgi:type VI secretion system protein ImpC
MTDDTLIPRPRIGFGGSSPGGQDLIPLRLIGIADLAPEDSPSRDTAQRLWSVDKDNFNEVLRALCPRVSFHVQSLYGSGFTRIEFPLTDLKSFHPTHLVQQVEPLRKLIEARQAVLDLRDQKLSPELFLEKIQSVPHLFSSARNLPGRPKTEKTPGRASVISPVRGTTSVPRDDRRLDSILDLVEMPQESTAEPAYVSPGALRIQQFIDAMSEGSAGRRPVDRSLVEGMLAETDSTLSAWLNEILSNPEFRRLEGAWRALRFLIDRTDFREAIRLQVVCARREELESVLCGLVADAGAVEVPVAAVITDFEFGGAPQELDQLRAAAQQAEQLQAPLLVNVGSRFFGRQSVAEAARIPMLKSHLEAAEFVKWRSFREAEASRWVGIGFNRFLLRSRYDESSTERLPFRFRQSGEGLWGNASWAIGALLVRSFAQTQWCGHITGLRGGGAVEGLPLQPWRLPSGEEIQIPLETIFLQGRESDFYEEGFLALQASADQDTAVLVRAPTAHRPERYSGVRETESSSWRSTLTYQLIASRLAQYLNSLIGKSAPSAAPSELRIAVERGLRDLIRSSDAAAGSGFEVRVTDCEERPGFLELLIKVQPGPSIWSVPAHVELSFPVRKA